MAVRVCEKNHTPFERDQEKEEAFEHAWRKTSSLIDGIVEKKLFDSFDVVWRAVEEPDHSILRVITLSGNDTPFLHITVYIDLRKMKRRRRRRFLFI